MELFARVIVGVDGTEWGFGALRQTLLLAPERRATVDAVTALDTAPAIWTGFASGDWGEILVREAEETRAESAAMLQERGSARVIGGKPVPVLRQARDEANATLLALGGRLSSRLLGILLGDTVTELLHDGRCSVLIARPAADGVWEPRRLVVGMDGSPAALAALEAADEIASRLRASVEVVAADGIAAQPDDSEWKKRIDRREESNPASALIGYSRDADLLVVGSRGLRGLRALGSVSEKVAHQALCSVLVVHPPAEM
jgi:nucleotide-binding universal stress UspA family protein